MSHSSQAESERRWPRRLLRVVLLLVVVLVPIELCAYIAARSLVSMRFLYEPSDAAGFADYVKKRDPLLGWPSPRDFGAAGSEYDASGSRIVPQFPDPNTHSCVALFGDSFTWGADVTPEQSYGSVLGRRLGCRVANYGVGGYGTDQAYLRYLHREPDPAKIIVLGHYSENIIRNVNRLRDFMVNTSFGLKPRFVLDARGTLQLLPMPAMSAEDYADPMRRAATLLQHEYFLPDGDAGIAQSGPPYMLSVLRALGHYRMRARFTGEPSYAQFYRADHPSGALAVTVAILREFVRTAKARGHVPVILMIPDQKDLITLKERGKLPFAPLVDALARDGIRTPKLAERLLAHLGKRDPCALYTVCSSGHFNAEGYAQVAAVVYDWFVEEHLLPLIM